jgi:hypothetical protein
VYYRGTSEIKNGEKVIVKLPDYVHKFASDLTMIVTPIYDGVLKVYNVSEFEQDSENSFTVYGVNGRFNWVVYGSRGFIEVEPTKNNVVVHGEGPYKWIC